VTAVEALQRMADKSLSGSEYLASCFDRIHQREGEVQAWECLAAPQPVSHGKGLLQNIPVGIKDIYDTRDFPTRWGTDYIRCDRSVSDASPVALLKNAGAFVMGKTVSTEFAYFSPGKTRNPYDLDRTPGGSSSGSAAAVADGMVPIALGTQTAGSITRPASYCNVIGFKPTYGLISRAGIKPFSETLDTVGYFARSVNDIALVHAALTCTQFAPLSRLDLAGLKIGVIRVPSDGDLDRDVEGALDRTCQRLSAEGVAITSSLGHATELDRLVELQSLVMAFESSRCLADVYFQHGDDMSDKLREILERGFAITLDEYCGARQETERLQSRVATLFKEVDLLLSPSAVNVAPLASGVSTGDPLYSRAWTLLGLPTISLPIESGHHGMPVGMQLIAPRYRDSVLLGYSHELLARLGRYARALDE
jgi:Asp-tRNA(Asn)/Glu-tRNA(Gln) amidotransferase A subunit family amidase